MTGLHKEFSQLKPGDHLCLIYQKDKDRFYTSLLFILEGLKRREKVVVIEDVEIADLLSEFIDVEGSIAKGQLVFLEDDSLLKHGYFDYRKLIKDLEDLEKLALEEGFKGLRVLINFERLFYSFEPEKLYEWEAEANQKRGKKIMLCMYNERKFDHSILAKVLLAHPKVTLRRRVIENFLYHPPEVFLKKIKIGEEDYEMLEKKIIEIDELKKKFYRIQEQYSAIYSSLSDGVIMLKNEIFVGGNPKILEMFGYRLEEILGKKFYELSPKKQPDGRNSKQIAAERIRAALDGEPQFFEWRFRRADGSLIDTEITLTRFKLDGEYHLIGIVRDITERKKIEEELKRSEERYRDLWENSNDIIFIFDTSGYLTDMNKMALETFGYSKDEIRKIGILDLLDKRYHDFVLEKIREIVEYKQPSDSLEFLGRTKDGREIWVEMRARPIIDKGKVIAIQGIARDITERKKVIENLKESEEMFRAICSASIDAIIMTDDFGRIVFWNDAATRMFGYRAEEVLGQEVFKLIVPKKYHTSIKAGLKLFQKFGKARIEGKTFESTGIRKDGTEFPIEISFASVKFRGKWHAVVVIRDISERKRVEEELRESEEKLRKIFESATSLIAILDENGVFVESNAAMAKSLGVDPVGKNLYDVLPEEVAKKRMEYLRRVLRESKAVSFEDSRNDREFYNTLLPIRLKGRSYCMVIASDITKMKRMNRFLKTINEINKLIFYEKNAKILLDRACRLLSSLREHYSVWIGLKKDKEVELVSYHGESRLCPEKLESLECIRLAEERGAVKLTPEERRYICPHYSGDDLLCYVIPMVVEGSAVGFVTIHSLKELPEEERLFELLETLASDIAFALRAIELDEAKKKAYSQIERNIEEFAILVDQIRNPLSAIAGIAELKISEDEIKKTILDAVERIDEVVRRLDRGWLDSEKVRMFLKKYLS